MSLFQQETINVSEEDISARYYRVTFKPPFEKNNNTTSVESVIKYPRLIIPNSININLGQPTKRYVAVGRCIYCGTSKYQTASDNRLSDEHIIAEGLGAKLLLPESSCEECAKLTCDTEGAILQTLFLAPRGQLKIRGKKRKRNRDGYPLSTVVDGKEVVICMPIEEHPSILLMLNLHNPRLLYSQGGISGIWVHTFGTPESAVRRGVKEIASPGFDTVRFCQMLAKIAHSYAYTHLRILSFRPLLTGFIRKKFKKTDQYPECYNFVGGHPTLFSPTEALHQIGHDIVRVGNRRFFVVYVRLFSSLGAPLYKVVVGEMNAYG
jgi:hypothetical protein